MARQGKTIVPPDGNSVQISVTVEEDGESTFSYVDGQGNDVSDFLIRQASQKDTQIEFYANPNNPGGPCKDFKIQFRPPSGSNLLLTHGKYGTMMAGQFTSTPGETPPTVAGAPEPTQAITVKVQRPPLGNRVLLAPMDVFWTFGGNGPLKGQTYYDDPDGYFEC